MPTKEINPEIKELLTDFCNEYILPMDLFLDKDKLLAIVTYGSSLTGFSSKNSDVDLLIIANRAEKVTRGVKMFRGRKIEYFIKPIEAFLSEGVKFTKSNCPSHVALYQNAYFLLDKCNMQEFMYADSQFYNENRERPKQNYDLKLVQIENRIASLKNILERGGKEFFMVYYNILKMLRAYHSARSEEADIPFAKAYRVYNDADYYNKFVSNNASNPLPDQEFVRLYNLCVEEHSGEQNMLNNLENLYDYEKKFVSIDPTNYEIKL